MTWVQAHLDFLNTRWTMQVLYQGENLFLIWMSMTVTFSPKPDRVERYNSTPKWLQSPHSPLKKALIPRYESTYQGDQYDTLEVTRAWDAFVTVRDKNKRISQTRVSSPPRPLPLSYKVVHIYFSTNIGRTVGLAFVRSLCSVKSSITQSQGEVRQFCDLLAMTYAADICRALKIGRLPPRRFRDYVFY
ncbi:unnamed protein product [Mytilus coruscus]|uniref:Uncharacterized protein n=1 Tax=Mytilus coruscus TaxID=42192 RepID=A0A6J7ZVV5_MYTCO|nr:unnamed protein product [Mytilus coruscus]